MSGLSSNSSEKEPVLSFSKTGTYILQLEVSNGKKTKKIQKEIIIVPDKGFAIIKDVKLGISSASQTIGSYFSSKLRTVFKENESISKVQADQIDLVYFGLNDSFSFNQFVSPHKAQSVGFNANFTNQTKVINVQTLVLPEDFTKLDLTKLMALDAQNTLETSKFFGATPLPKVVLFETQTGKKGAVLIKQIVKDGNNSYLIADFRVMK